MTLAELKLGEVAEIIRYASGNSIHRTKLLALGLTKGTRLEIVNIAPLGDPLEIAVRGYHLSLRKDEADVIKVKKID